MQYLFVQDDTTKLFNYLDNNANNELIFYTNVKSILKIGNEILTHKQFDTIIYTINPEFFIMLQRYGIISYKELIEYLQKRNISFNEVSFLEDKNIYENDDSIKKIEPVFCEEDFLSALYGEDNGIFYPKIKSKIELFFNVDNKTVVPLHTFKFNGILTTKRKIILFPRLIKLNPITICRENNFNLTTTYNDEPKTHISKKLYKQLH